MAHVWRTLEKPFFDRSYNRLYDARPMSGGLPASIDPIRLADQNDHLSGTIPLNRMKRLLTCCRSDEGVVNVDLLFHYDGQRDVRTITGTLSIEISLNCERCLEPLILPLRCEVNLLALLPGQENLAETGDALIVSDPVSLIDLVENELILALPMIPMHPRDQCSATKRVMQADSGSTTPEPEQGDSRESPFAKLAKLKRFDRE